MAGYDNSAAFEAEEMVRTWLDKVEKESIMGAAKSSMTQSHPHMGVANTLGYSSTSTELTDDSTDLMSMVDWEGGSITETTRSILDALMTKNIPHAARMNDRPKLFDPRVTMEMRHKQVKDRRVHRDAERRQQLESRLLLEEAQREAREVVLMEEREMRKKAAMEEKLIKQQISLIRGQIREQRRATNQLVAVQRKAIESELKKKKKKKKEKERNGELEKVGLADVLLASPTVAVAEKIVEDERRRQQTHSELVRQLEEAETQDLKERMRLLRSYFSAWYEEVVILRAKVRRASALRNWKLMAQVWGAWRRWAVLCKNRREEAAATREMQRNMRLYKIASEHYECSLLLRALHVWYRVIRVARSQRKEKEEEDERKKKMQSLLRTAKEVSETRRITSSSTQFSPPLPPPNSGTPLSSPSGTEPPQHLVSKSSDSSHLLEAIPTAEAATRPARKPPVPKFSTLHSEPSIYKMAQQEMVEILQEAQVKAAAKTRLHQRPSSPGMEKDNPGPRVLPEAWGPLTRPLEAAAMSRRSLGTRAECRPLELKQHHVRPKPKPVTKPMAMTGMETRAAAAAERKLAREKRREAQIKEKAEKLAREEEERQQAEQLAREAALQRKREERRLAKQKEQEKQRKQHLLEELNKKASNHYRSVLLYCRGLTPWRKFVLTCRENWLAAEKMSQQQMLRRTFTTWQIVWRKAEEEKERVADDLHCVAVMRKTWKAWRMSVVISQEYESYASKLYPHLLVKTHFRGWRRVVKEELTDYWEKSMCARRFRQRFLQHQVLKAWHTYVPEAREERAREQRRAQLRLKVSTWLPDFVGRSYNDDDDSDYD